MGGEGRRVVRVDACGVWCAAGCFDCEASAAVMAEHARAAWAFEPTGEGQLRMAKGDMVEVIKRQDEHWAKVRRGAEEGFVPAAYIKTMPRGAQPPAAAAEPGAD